MTRSDLGFIVVLSGAILVLLYAFGVTADAVHLGWLGLAEGRNIPASEAAA